LCPSLRGEEYYLLLVSFERLLQKISFAIFNFDRMQG